MKIKEIGVTIPDSIELIMLFNFDEDPSRDLQLIFIALKTDA